MRARAFLCKKKKRREGMFALFENLTNWLWGLPLLITILVTGIYLTIRSGFFQFRHFGHIVKNMFSKERREEEMTPTFFTPPMMIT